jgi:aryl-alcohol dehydrogenase-like predicted oxidoreductase
MDYVKLAQTDRSVSRIAFGCEPLGGTDWGNIDEQQVLNAVSHALDLGVNLFDTADVYGLGRSEEMLAQALGPRRHDVVIISKFGLNWTYAEDGGRARTFRDSSPRRVVEALENTLRRLRIDTLPIYLIHWPDPNTPVAETLEALARCQEEGKVGAVGVSNFPIELLREANTLHRLSVTELSYNIIDRKAETDVMPYCQEKHINLITYGPLAQGLLTGKYDISSYFEKNDRRHRLPHFHQDNLAENLHIVERLKEVGSLHQKTPAQVALQWVLSNPSVSCAIVGAKSPRQIEENVKALDIHLSPEDRDYIAHGALSAQVNGE